MGHVLCMGKNRNVYRVWLGNLNLRDHLEDVGVDESIILKWILKKWDGRLWMIYLYMIQCSHSSVDESVLGYDLIGFI